jgi:NAD(P)-dependent dehydrogenase (short-subunit alcohol dehydrogenase family)
LDTTLKNRTALITGGSLGLGFAMAQAFYAEGARVAIVARREGPLQDAVATIGQHSGGEIIGVVCDVADGASIQLAHADIVNQLGPVDILVNNAGAAATRPFLESSDEDWQQDIDLKLMAAVRLTRLVWPHMQEQNWGRVINVLNTAAKAPGANTAPTSVTRAAGMALTKVLSAEGAANNILVNAMLIGLIKSDQVRRWHAASGANTTLDEHIDKLGKGLPLGRMGEAYEVANLALFLASQAGSYVTGCAINMDGGLSKVV